MATNVVVTNVNDRLQRRPLVPTNIKLIGVHLLTLQVWLFTPGKQWNTHVFFVIQVLKEEIISINILKKCITLIAKS